MRPAARRFFRFFPAAVLYGFIFYLSSRERWPVEVGWGGFDKLAHAAVFGLLGICLGFGFGGKDGAKSPWVPFGTGSLLAVLDEVHQLFVPGRKASPWDTLADILGIALGIWLQRKFVRPRSRTAKGRSRASSGRDAS